MDLDTDSALQTPSVPTFRAPRQKRHLRARLSSPEHNARPSPPQDDGAPTQPPDLTALRRARPRRAGVAFSSSAQPTERTMTDAPREPDPANKMLEVVAGRFMAQTGRGTEGEADRHMMAYIDAKLAAMREGEQGGGEEERRVGGGVMTARVPAGVGKLMEIDLGPEVARRNVERTEEAKRRLVTGEGDVDEEVGPKRKDGRPWRKRKRRGSEDVKRDRLVEEVLKESRLDIYDEPKPDSPPAADDDQAADDRIAEQFRQDFLDAMSAKHVRRAVPQPAGQVADRPKGPKLGGSRSARAAMREAEKRGPAGKKR
ncbi:hypothetical protein EJ06DRAFT_580489 [Trichodelitschia bisporula]|uniref:mRNA splicing factor RNA helicase n=1 Tax=Trichodelitschia bisporula TaxID=703511 RepID=A0A6G1I283_9PEZI|nr:hypothetical protein EJ06DRAFT_580489 [Trichodelitschia bisporula]